LTIEFTIEFSEVDNWNAFASVLLIIPALLGRKDRLYSNLCSLDCLAWRPVLPMARRQRSLSTKFDSMDQNEKDTGRCPCPDCTDEYCDGTVRRVRAPRIMSKYMMCGCCGVDWPEQEPVQN
jgi:hypothetical protein